MRLPSIHSSKKKCQIGSFPSGWLKNKYWKHHLIVSLSHATASCRVVTFKLQQKNTCWKNHLNDSNNPNIPGKFNFLEHRKRSEIPTMHFLGAWAVSFKRGDSLRPYLFRCVCSRVFWGASEIFGGWKPSTPHFFLRQRQKVSHWRRTFVPPSASLGELSGGKNIREEFKPPGFFFLQTLQMMGYLIFTISINWLHPWNSTWNL